MGGNNALMVEVLLACPPRDARTTQPIGFGCASLTVTCLGAGLHLHFTKKRCKQAAAGAPAAPAAAAPQQQQPQPQCPAQAFLEAINLGIYADAFLLAGYGGSSAAELAALTDRDLDRIQRAAKVPILAHHKRLILAACKQLSATLVSICCGHAAWRHRPRFQRSTAAAPGAQVGADIQACSNVTALYSTVHPMRPWAAVLQQQPPKAYEHAVASH